jgi:hypothetical protein
MILLLDAMPTGVTEATTLGALGPTLYVLLTAGGIAAGALAMWFRARSLVRAEMVEFIGSRDGVKVLDEGRWAFVKGEDFARWLKGKVDDHTSAQTQALLVRMEHLADSVSSLANGVEKLVDRLDRREEELRELERQFLQDKADRAKAA